jgi:ribonuclease HII
VLVFEQRAWAKGCRRVAGVDEAGRGPLAGPVVAAAVFIPPSALESAPDHVLAGLTDSKQLSPGRRSHFYSILTGLSGVDWAVGTASVEEIDAVNILQATYLAMRRAVEGLSAVPDHLLVDGRPVPNLPVASTAIVRGDGQSFSIAAASVVAKVTRDALMQDLDAAYPAYGFSRNKGYGTREHREALRDLGPCPCHRRSFAPVRQLRLSL